MASVREGPEATIDTRNIRIGIRIPMLKPIKGTARKTINRDVAWLSKPNPMPIKAIDIGTRNMPKNPVNVGKTAPIIAYVKVISERAYPAIAGLPNRSV